MSTPASPHPYGKFKNANGMWRTNSLFAERSTAVDGTESAVYTLNAEDWRGFPSLKKLFMETGDPTGYKMAIEHLGGYEHFKVLLDYKRFAEAFREWQLEMSAKYQAEGLARLLEMSKDKSHRSSVDLNKFLLNRGWLTQEEKSKGGRPKKSDIREAAIQISTKNGAIDEDFERVLASGR